MLVRIASGAVLTVIVGAGLIFGGPYLFILTLQFRLPECMSYIRFIILRRV